MQEPTLEVAASAARFARGLATWFLMPARNPAEPTALSRPQSAIAQHGARVTGRLWHDSMRAGLAAQYISYPQPQTPTEGGGGAMPTHGHYTFSLLWFYVQTAKLHIRDLAPAMGGASAGVGGGEAPGVYSTILKTLLIHDTAPSLLNSSGRSRSHERSRMHIAMLNYVTCFTTACVDTHPPAN